MSEKLGRFLSSVNVNCPCCGTRTKYQRHGYDGVKGEGQFCSSCKKFVFFSTNQLLWLTEDKWKEVAEGIQYTVDKQFEKDKEMGWNFRL